MEVTEMFATKAVFYDSARRVPISDLTWSAIEAAVRQLDGDRFTAVYVSKDDAWLSVGGGNEGLYMVTGGKNSDTAITLVDPKGKRRGGHRLVCSGVENTYPPYQCLQLQPVLHTLQQFAERGDFDAGRLKWE